jgi:NADH dehydrogenase (ubiquinone) 1 alpha subcomplex subunit 8
MDTDVHDRVSHRESMHPPSKSGAVEDQPMPSHVPQVPEIGATSAALKSASFFIAAKCQPYHDDFMLCRKEKWDTHGPGGCLKEGRKVTRCAISVYVRCE